MTSRKHKLYYIYCMYTWVRGKVCIISHIIMSTLSSLASLTKPDQVPSGFTCPHNSTIFNRNIFQNIDINFDLTFNLLLITKRFIHNFPTFWIIFYCKGEVKDNRQFLKDVYFISPIIFIFESFRSCWNGTMTWVVSKKKRSLWGFR